MSLKEIKWDAVDLNSNSLDCCIQKNEGKILWFSADCFGHIELNCKDAYLDFHLNKDILTKVFVRRAGNDVRFCKPKKSRGMNLNNVSSSNSCQSQNVQVFQ